MPDLKSLPEQLTNILWVGGMSGIGKTTGARAVARRYDLRLYSLDARTYVHAARTDLERHPVLASYSILSRDELWVEPEPEEIAERFIASSRERLELVVEDLLALSKDVPILVDGPQLFPSLIRPLVRSAGHAIYLVADPALHRELVAQRGGSLSAARTRDQARARENRLLRDEYTGSRGGGRTRVQARGDRAPGAD
jgi:2-phosphoglycerate kinase